MALVHSVRQQIWWTSCLVRHIVIIVVTPTDTTNKSSQRWCHGQACNYHKMCLLSVLFWHQMPSKPLLKWHLNSEKGYVRHLPFSCPCQSFYICEVWFDTSQEGRKGWLRRNASDRKETELPFDLCPRLSHHNTQPLEVWRICRVQKGGERLRLCWGKRIWDKSSSFRCSESKRRLGLGSLRCTGSRPSSADIWH